ncbi:hypothetical protein E2C01_048986 [Portunus trituberculatus]|uniref:Uncharacterized protein n=1 Tax=Portunus trituberculatus TaxID=210409 RepID=A0A5B7GCP9_PORTR|nr:hypothetical protein [Portunus trituberculatus]
MGLGLCDKGAAFTAVNRQSIHSRGPINSPTQTSAHREGISGLSCPHFQRYKGLGCVHTYHQLYPARCSTWWDTLKV